jgi:hypothetical protein
MKKFLFSSVLMLVTLVFLVFYLFPVPAHAHELTSRECYALARDVSFFATLRENVTEEDLVTKLLPIMTAYKGNPDTYIHDDEDIKMLLGVIGVIYEHPEVDPEAIKTLVFQSCTGTVGSAPVKTQKPQLSI